MTQTGLFSYRGKVQPHAYSFNSKTRTIILTVRIPRNQVLISDYIEWKAKGLIIKESPERVLILAEPTPPHIKYI